MRIGAGLSGPASPEYILSPQIEDPIPPIERDIASRSENIILKFDSDFKPMKFECKLADNPEFLLHVERRRSLMLPEQSSMK